MWTSRCRQSGLFAAWNRSWIGAAALRSFGVTTAQSTSAVRCKIGRSNAAFALNTSSRVSHNKMPTLNALTARFVMNGWRSISSIVLTKCRTTPRSGYGITITNARTWHWADLPRSSGLPWLRSFYLCSPLNMGSAKIIEPITANNRSKILFKIIYIFSSSLTV